MEIVTPLLSISVLKISHFALSYNGMKVPLRTHKRMGPEAEAGKVWRAVNSLDLDNFVARGAAFWARTASSDRVRLTVMREESSKLKNRLCRERGRLMKTYGRLLLLVLIVGAFTTSGTARDKQLPLPPQVMTAKTVYIDNQSGIAKMGDKCYDEIQKWGRFQVVQNIKQADLILLLSAREYTRGYVTSGGDTTGTINSTGEIDTTTNGDRTTGTINSNGTVQTTTSPTLTRRVTVGYTYITAIDPKTGENLWSDSKKWGTFHSATKGLVDELVKRINENPTRPLSPEPIAKKPSSVAEEEAPPAVKKEEAPAAMADTSQTKVAYVVKRDGRFWIEDDKSLRDDTAAEIVFADTTCRVVPSSTISGWDYVTVCFSPQWKDPRFSGVCHKDAGDGACLIGWRKSSVPNTRTSIEKSQ